MADSDEEIIRNNMKNYLEKLDQGNTGYSYN